MRLMKTYSPYTELTIMKRNIIGPQPRAYNLPKSLSSCPSGHHDEANAWSWLVIWYHVASRDIN